MTGRAAETNEAGRPRAQMAGGASWHQSRYNNIAAIPDKKTYAVVNLLRGSCVELSLAEVYLLSIAESLDKDHPILPRFERAGLVSRCDELAILAHCVVEALSKSLRLEPRTIGIPRTRWRPQATPTSSPCTSTARRLP